MRIKITLDPGKNMWYGNRYPYYKYLHSLHKVNTMLFSKQTYTKTSSPKSLPYIFSILTEILAKIVKRSDGSSNEVFANEKMAPRKYGYTCK